IAGHLSSAELEHFPHFTATVENGQMVLSGPIARHSELYALLERLRSLDLTLLSVMQAEPNLEQIFVELIDRSENAMTRLDHNSRRPAIPSPADYGMQNG